MSPILIAVIVFAIAIAVFSYSTTRSSKSVLALETGENPIIDESPVRVDHQSPVRTAVYPRCRVLVTDRRVLIAQKGLFGTEYSVPRFVISLSDEGKKTDLGSSLKSGVLFFSISRNMVGIETDADLSTVSISIPDSALTGRQRVTYLTARADEYRRLQG